jgi:hypothetical protein
VARQPIERTYAASRDEVWEALRATLTELDYQVNEDPPTYTVEFRTGMSLWTWGGQELTATLQDAPSGGTNVSLAGGMAVKAQFTAWGERKRIAKKVFAGIERQLTAQHAAV